MPKFPASTEFVERCSASKVARLPIRKTAAGIFLEPGRSQLMVDVAMLFQMFRDSHHLWRWTLIVDARVMAHSAQGYETKSDCLQAINKVKESGEARVEEV